MCAMKRFFVPFVILLILAASCQNGTTVKSPLSEEDVKEVLELPEVVTYQATIIELVAAMSGNFELEELQSLLNYAPAERFTGREGMLGKLSALEGGEAVVEKLTAFESAAEALQAAANFTELDQADRDKIQLAAFQDVLPELIGALEQMRNHKIVDVDPYIKELEKEMANR